MRVGLGTAKVLQYTLQVGGHEGVGRVGGRDGGVGRGGMLVRVFTLHCLQFFVHCS